MAHAVNIDGLRRTLLIYAAAGAFLIGVAAAALSVLPFFDRLHTFAADTVSDHARVAARSIGALVSGRHQVVRLITSRTQARVLLEDFNSGRVDETVYRERTATILADALQSADDVTGVIRIPSTGSVRVAVGRSVDENLWPADWASVTKVTAHGPVITDEGARIVLASPIFDHAQARIGTDIVVMTVQAIADQLASSKSEAGGSTRVFLVFRDGGHIRYLLADGSTIGQQDVPQLSPSTVGASLMRSAGMLTEYMDRGQIVSIAPTGTNNWAVLVMRSADEVLGGLNEELMLVAMAVLTLTLLGSGGIYLLLRPLTGNLVIHADALAEKVRHATADAEQARDRADGARRMVESAYGELKRTQETLLQAEKMASLGGLVAGVAHEINTPVGIVVTGASFLAGETDKLKRAYQADDLSTEDLEHYLSVAEEATGLIQSNAMRAADLIQSFKQVAVDQTAGERRSIDLAAYVAEVLASLKPHLKKLPIELDLSIPAGLELDTFPGALSQVLTNLVMNALTHAFEPGQPGTLTISAEDKAGSVVLRFADDGKGIATLNRNKVFEPFFTTKRNAGGSGLGLHIVFNLVTRTLGGTVILDKAEKGCVFLIRIPKHAPEASRVTAERDAVS